MNLVRRDNWPDFDKVFDDFFAPRHMSYDMPEGYFSPRVDIKEKEDSYEISAELPGVKKEDMNVHVKDGVLTIEASHEEEKNEEKDGKIIRKERRTGRFMRSFNLGTDVHEEDIKANFENGVLVLEAPKRKPEVPTARKIEIK